MMFIIYTKATRVEPGPTFPEEMEIHGAALTENNPEIIPPDVYDHMLFQNYGAAWANGRDDLVKIGGCRESLSYVEHDMVITALCWVDKEKALDYAANSPPTRVTFSMMRAELLKRFGMNYDPEWYGFDVPDGIETYDLTIVDFQKMGYKL